MVLFIGQTFAGKTHDYTMLKSEFPAEEAWFTDTELHVDLGYQGIQSDYQGKRICIPHKKPRKSKHKPDPQLTPAQKQENRTLAKLKVPVETCYRGHQALSLLVAPYRNHKNGFEDDVLVIAAALWNFWLA